MTEPSLYERLGGTFAIAAQVDRFSDAVVRNPIVDQQSENPALREGHTTNLSRLPDLTFMHTLRVCPVAGGPFEYSPTRPGQIVLDLDEAHQSLRVSPAEIVRTLDLVEVPERECTEAREAFAAHKGEVTEGYVTAVAR